MTDFSIHHALPYQAIDTPVERSPMRFVWRYVLRFPWWTFGMCASETGAKILVVILPLLLKEMLDRMAHAGDPSALLHQADFILICAGFVVLPFLIEVCKRLCGVFDYLLSPAITSSVRVEMFSYIQRHAHDFFMNRFAGSVGNKITQTSSAVRDVCWRIFRDFIPLVLAFGLTAALTLPMNMVLGVVFLIWLVLFMGVTISTAPKISGCANEYANARSRFTGRIVDNLTNAVSVRAYHAYPRELHSISKLADMLSAYGRRVIWHVEMTRIVQSVMIFGLVSIVSCYAIYQWGQGRISLGSLAFLLPVTITLTALANDVAARMIEFFEQYGTIAEGLEFMAHPYDITDSAGAMPLTFSRGTIRAEALTFSYDGGKGERVFDALNFEIPGGQKVGLVGHSGAGKSSLVNLLLRFHDPESGALTIDGQDIRRVTQQSLRDAISYIPQETSLFHMSLYDNIAFAKPDATESEVIEAARRSHAAEFIERLPEGYKTIVGERGLKLSGGQRQRIAIARAILKNAPILILDEATSALDSESEKIIQTSLLELMEGKTVVAIAHRLSTISRLDRLIVMSHGRIIEDGSHAALLKQGGHYAHLWSLQSGGFLGD